MRKLFNKSLGAAVVAAPLVALASAQAHAGALGDLVTAVGFDTIETDVTGLVVAVAGVFLILWGFTVLLTALRRSKG
jgi:uncharacterized protein HemY